MLKLLIDFAVFSAIALASLIPLQRLRKVRRHRRVDIKRWAQVGMIVSVVTTATGWTGRRLQDQCLAQINSGCVDAGTVGLQTIILGGFVFMALFSAFMLWRD